MAKSILLVGAGEAATAVSLAIAKEHLRVLHTRHDLSITDAILSAQNYLEEELGLAIVPQTYLLSLDKFEQIVDLDPYNATEILEVKYTDVFGDEKVLDGASYSLEHGRPCSIVFNTMPAIKSGSKVKVKYKAGFVELPAVLRRAILMLVSTFYDFENDVVIGRLVSEMPITVDRLVHSFKILKVC